MFKKHKARSNASNVQVSTSNFTQTSDRFWMPIRVLEPAEGNLTLREEHRGRSSGPTCPVKEKNTQCYTAASAEDPSPRLRTATSLLFPDLVTDSLKAKKMLGIVLLIHVLQVPWRGCMKCRQTGRISWFRLRFGRENDGGELLMQYCLKPLQPSCKIPLHCRILLPQSGEWFWGCCNQKQQEQKLPGGYSHFIADARIFLSCGDC